MRSRNGSGETTYDNRLPKDVDSENVSNQANSNVSSGRNKRLFYKSLIDWLGSSFGSVVFHILVLFLLFWVITHSARRDGLREGRQTDSVGIVLSDSDSNLEQVEDVVHNADERMTTEQNADQLEESETTTELQNLAEQFLPSIEIGTKSESGELSSKLATSSSQSSGGSGGQSVGFGDSRGSGRKFVYVLDRSDSMNWKGGAPMRRMIADAIASVNSLEPKLGAQKFQLIVYNQDVDVFEQGTGLIDTSPNNKARAVRFLNSLVAGGSTNSEKALERAIKMRPDVVFFLTDADEEMSEYSLHNLQALRRQFKVKQICVVEFGRSSEPRKESFKRFAGENGGSYVFKDVDSF